MRKLLFALLAGALMCGSVQAQEAPRLDGADLFIDLAKYVGHQVIVKNVNVFGATNDGALGRASGVAIKISTTGIDTETFRYFLKNCSSIRGCNVHLLATPTGDKYLDQLILMSVKIAQ